MPLRLLFDVVGDRDRTQRPPVRADYYPFGLQMPGRTYVSGTPTREGFTGHELDAETGLNYAGARYYMPALGRWTSTDPLAAGYPSLSPYNYVANNPISLVDPNGMWIQEIDDDGNITFRAEEGDNYTTFRNQYGLGSATADFLREKGIDPSSLGEDSVLDLGVGLRLNLDNATDQDILNQLSFAIEYALQSGEDLRAGKFFKGLSRGSGRRLDAREGEGLYFLMDGEQTSFRNIDMDLNIDGSVSARTYPETRSSVVGTFQDPRDVTLFYFNRPVDRSARLPDGRPIPGTRLGIPVLSFTLYPNQAESFLRWIDRNRR